MVSAKLLLSVAVIILAFFLVLVSAFRIAHPGLLQKDVSQTVFASVNPDALTEAEATASALRKTSQGINYSLPYPGILPDHPLYWLKMVRDRVTLILTRDSLKRFDLLLLYADKRLSAGQALISRNQVSLGVTTITKAEKYLHQAFAQLQVHEKVPVDKKETLAKAYLKHKEVIKSLKENVDGTSSNVLEVAWVGNENTLNEKLKEFLPQENLGKEASSSANQ